MRYLINKSSVKPLSHNYKYSETKTFKKKPRVFKIMIYFQHRLSTETCDTRQDQSVRKKSISFECRVSNFTYKTTLVSWGWHAKHAGVFLLDPIGAAWWEGEVYQHRRSWVYLHFIRKNTTWKRYDIVLYIFFLRG